MSHHIVCRPEGQSLPFFLIQVQDRPCLDGKLRITWKNPTAILPRFDGIGTQPPPDGDSTDAGNYAMFHNVPLEVFPTESRQRNTKSRRQFARQRFNRHYDSGGKTGQAARFLDDRSAHPCVFRKIVYAIYSLFVGVCRIWQRFDHWRALCCQKNYLGAHYRKIWCRISLRHALKFFLLFLC
jgi:hypothetical protein